MTPVTSIESYSYRIIVYRIGLLLAGILTFIILGCTASFAQSDTIYGDMNILYDTTTENNLVESVGYLNGSQLLSTPSSSITNALTGRIAGLYTSQSSGEPGNDAASLKLRGRSPMILIDGIPRSILSINPEQIESVTVLKDALSAAMLGIRSGDGAILITTKKGLKKKGLHIDFKAQTGVSAPLKLPDPLSAYNYAMLYNEALENDGRSPIYSASDLDAYKNGTDPYGHPDINWYKKILKKQAPNKRFTLDAEGANENVKYFVSLDYLNQEGLFKDFGVNTYSSNTEYQRYLFRSNVDAKLTSRFSMSLDIFGSIENQNEPGTSAGSIMNALLVTPNNAYPMLNPDTSLGGNLNYQDNIYGQLEESGYHSYVYRTGYADLSLKRQMDDILKGWWVKGTLSYTLGLNQHIDRSKNFETFQMQISPSGDTAYQRYGTKSIQSNSSSVTSRQHDVYAALYSGYSHKWGDNKLDVLLMYNVDNATNNWTLPNKYSTLSGKATYNINNKYILQAAAAYSGNNHHEKAGRFGLFPAVGAAWNIHNESFFNKEGFVNKLKLRATYGLNANSVTGVYSNGYYQYIDRWSPATGYRFGSSYASAPGLAQQNLRDVHSWENVQKLDVGLDVGFARNRGSLTLDYYRNRFTNMVSDRGKNSALLGWGSTIYENLAEYSYSGLEISAGWSSANHSSNENVFNYYINGNLSFSQSENVYIDEPDYPYSWMQHTGLPVGQAFGYIADGFVTTAGEGPVMEGYQSVPGDLKYKDLNDDGVINQFDRKAIGTQKPLVFYGVDFGFSWKNFSLTFLLQGVTNRDIFLTGNQEWAFKNVGKGQAYSFQLDRWTPATGASATRPRLTVGKNVNNDVGSTFWLYSGNYMRLKNVELSYSFKNIQLGKEVKVHNLRLFINGLNLWTISALKHSDPEVLLGSYPMQRVINGGVFIQF